MKILERIDINSMRLIDVYKDIIDGKEPPQYIRLKDYNNCLCEYDYDHETYFAHDYESDEVYSTAILISCVLGGSIKDVLKSEIEIVEKNDKLESNIKKGMFVIDEYNEVYKVKEVYTDGFEIFIKTEDESELKESDCYKYSYNITDLFDNHNKKSMTALEKMLFNTLKEKEKKKKNA